jgi:hypothetical protein
MQTPAVSPAQALERLKSSNEPISSETFAKAQEILSILRALDAPSPFVFPTDLGGIQFEWHGSGRELDIEIVPNVTMLAYVAFQNGDLQKESDAEPTKAGLLALLTWMR